MHNPTFIITTKGAEEIWRKGDRVIYQVVATYEDTAGKERAGKFKTFSGTIAQKGFTGEIEAYEKENNRGVADMFIRQVPKEGYKDNRPGEPNKGSAISSPNSTNPYTMFLSYGKDLVVALIQAGTLDKESLDMAVKATVKAGNALYDSQPSSNTTDPVATASDPTPDDLDSLKDIFPEGEETVVDDDPFAGF